HQRPPGRAPERRQHFRGDGGARARRGGTHSGLAARRPRPATGGLGRAPAAPLVMLELTQQGLDVGRALHRTVGAELEGRRRPQVEVTAEPGPDEPLGARERGERRRPLLLAAQDRDEDLGQPQVARGLDLGHGHEPQTGILELPLEQERDLLLDELVDPVEALALHYRSSTDRSITYPSSFASMKSITLSTTSLASRESCETHATARVARCQES